MYGFRIQALAFVSSIPFLMAGVASGQVVGTVRFATGLDDPTFLGAPPLDTARVFVTELQGDIEILDAATGAQFATPFLSIAEATTLGSVAFDSDYATNGFLYVYYGDASNAVHLVRYTVMTGDPDHADPGSAYPIINISVGGHIGGWIGFGPDGYLYVTVGDGGNFMSHDAPNNAQSIEGELIGNVLRLDIDGDDFPDDPDRNYAIPSNNPFVGITGEDEIWASGLRNPWRAAFDRETGDFYIADVGQDTREELDFEPAGHAGGSNYGWRLREGSIATPTGGVGGPQPPGGIDPIYDYEHGSGDTMGDSITGGYVYRGPISSLLGRYFFADYVSDRIWSIRVDSGNVVEFADWTTAFIPDVGNIDAVVSFGEDAAGSLYIVDHQDGEIFRVVEHAPIPGLTPVGLIALAALLVGLGVTSLRRLA